VTFAERKFPKKKLKNVNGITLLPPERYFITPSAAVTGKNLKRRIWISRAHPRIMKKTTEGLSLFPALNP